MEASIFLLGTFLRNSFVARLSIFFALPLSFNSYMHCKKEEIEGKRENPPFPLVTIMLEEREGGLPFFSKLKLGHPKFTHTHTVAAICLGRPFLLPLKLSGSVAVVYSYI